MAKRNFKELRNEIASDPGRRKRLEQTEAQEREGYKEHVRRLGEVRKARELTQTQLARSLEVSQAQVSRIESQADLYLSTLEGYLAAMGGELEIVSVFPDTGARVPLAIGELSDRHEPA